MPLMEAHMIGMAYQLAMMRWVVLCFGQPPIHKG